MEKKYADISFAISASARGDGRGLFNNNRIYMRKIRARSSTAAEREMTVWMMRPVSKADTKKKPLAASYINF